MEKMVVGVGGGGGLGNTGRKLDKKFENENVYEKNGGGGGGGGLGNTGRKLENKFETKMYMKKMVVGVGGGGSGNTGRKLDNKFENENVYEKNGGGGGGGGGSGTLAENWTTNLKTKMYMKKMVVGVGGGGLGNTGRKLDNKFENENVYEKNGGGGGGGGGSGTLAGNWTTNLKMKMYMKKMVVGVGGGWEHWQKLDKKFEKENVYEKNGGGGGVGGGDWGYWRNVSGIPIIFTNFCNLLVIYGGFKVPNVKHTHKDQYKNEKT